MIDTTLLFKELFEKNCFAIIVINSVGIIEQFNPAAEKLFLYSAAEAIGQNINILMGSPNKEKHDDYLKKYLKTHISYDVIGSGRELVAQRKDGASLDVFLSVSETNIENETYFIATIISIDEIFGSQKMLQNLAKFDRLTKAYSRSYFESHAKKWLLKYQKNGRHCSCLMFDLNNFKNVNDTLGHTIGDKVLVAFSKRVQNHLTSQDYLVRLGGDEFLVVMEGARDKTRKFVLRLFADLEKIYDIANNSLSILPSIGVYTEIDTTDLSLLLQRVDFALYAAKRISMPIQFFTPHLEDQFREQHHFSRVIRDALTIHQDYFQLFFQPQQDLKTKKIIGFEALLRLDNHYSHSPREFIPLIEKLGLSKTLNSMLIDKLLTLLGKFQWATLAQDDKDNDIDKTRKKIKIAFNLSPQEYHFRGHLESLLKKIAVFSKTCPYILFEIEMTESKLMATDLQYPEQWAKVGNLLKKHQVQLAIDDFGREYSSIYRLLNYPVSTLKIDQIFTEQLNGAYKKAAKSIIKTVVLIGKELDITIIAEGVESKSQANWLKALGCAVGQGFYFSYPLFPEEAFSLVGVKLL